MDDVIVVLKVVVVSRLCALPKLIELNTRKGAIYYT